MTINGVRLPQPYWPIENLKVSPRPTGSLSEAGKQFGSIRAKSMRPVPRFDRMFARSAPGTYLEVRPFDLDRECPAATNRFLTPGPDIVGHREHAWFDPSGPNQILRKGCLRSRGFSLAVGLHRTIVSRQLTAALADLQGPPPRRRPPPKRRTMAST